MEKVKIILITLIISFLFKTNIQALELNSQFNVTPTTKVVTINRGTSSKFTLCVSNKYRYSKPSKFAKVANTVTYDITIDTAFKSKSIQISDYTEAIDNIKIKLNQDKCTLQANDCDYIDVYIDIPPQVPLSEYDFSIIFTKQPSKFGKQISREVIKIPVTLKVGDPKYTNLEYNATIDNVAFTVGNYKIVDNYTQRDTLKHLFKVLLEKTVDDLKYVILNEPVDTKYKYQPYVLKYKDNLYFDIVPNQMTHLYNVYTGNNKMLSPERYISVSKNVDMYAYVDSITTVNNSIILHTTKGDYTLVDTSNKFLEFIKQQLLSLSIYDKDTPFTVKEIFTTILVPKQCIYDTQLKVILDVNNKGTYTINPSVNSIVTRIDTSYQKMNNATISTMIHPKSKSKIYQTIDLNATPPNTKLTVNTSAYLYENYSPVNYTINVTTLNIREIINNIELTIILLVILLIICMFILLYKVHITNYRKKINSSINSAISFLTKHKE